MAAGDVDPARGYTVSNVAWMRLRRRSPGISVVVLVGLILAAGCTQTSGRSLGPAAGSGPAAQPSPSQPAGGAAQEPWQREWEQTVAAAKREGKVTVAGPSGAGIRDVMRDFEAQYPEITLEYTGIIGRDFGPRLMAERQGGLKLWDVYIGGGNTLFQVFKPAGAIADLRPALILPEVKEDKYWYGGFDFGFTDLDKQLLYAFQGTTSPPLYVNRRALPASEFNSGRQLTDPKLKGKIAWQDPRVPGSGAQNLMVMYMAYGEEWVTKLLTEQEIAFTLDLRQLTEWVVRGRYPVGISVRDNELVEFRQHGLTQEVEPMMFPELSVWTAGFGAVALVEGAPHPNAAKLYINWLLSRRAQELWVKSGTQDNSRRTDVPVASPATLPRVELLHQYVRNDEAWESTRLAAEQLAQRLIK
jgi:iron(III) transport system substrate-binding protein